MLNRQIGSILRGKATRLQVLLATVLGGLLGFVPGFFLPGDLGGGFAQSPGLVLLLLCLALVANANLAVFGLTTLVAKLLSVMLLPASYAVGVWLLDGPLQGLFRWLCNARVFAWFGFEYYATTGGLVLGLVFGVGLGLLLNALLGAIRRRMADVEENSERYQKYAKKWWVRLLGWLFLGGSKRKKKSWRDLAESRKLGLPIRISGVIVALVFVGSVLVFQQWFSTPILTTNTKAALEAGNGATVDLEEAALELFGGRIRVRDFAMADRANLTKNLLAAEELVMTVDTDELLRRRLVIDEVRAVAATTGTGRETPGVVIPSGEPEPEPEPAPAGVPTLEDVLAEYELWKGRLEQAREWIEVVFEGEESTVPPSTPEEIEKARKQQIEEIGFAGVVATHLVADRPFLVIRKIDIEGITWTHGGTTEQLALRLRDVSSAPTLLATPPTLSLAAASQSFALNLAGPSGSGDRIGVDLACKGLAVDSLLAGLTLDGKPAVRGGTIDFTVGGSLTALAGRAMDLDLPLAVTLRDTTLALGGRETAVEELALPVGLKGSLTRPAVYFENKAFVRALLDAGKTELADFVQQNASKLLGDLPGQFSALQGLGGAVDPNKSLEENAAAAQKKLQQELEAEAEKRKQELEEAAKKEAEKKLEKVLPGGLGGLLGGKKGGEDD
ncbi:MAG: hypothetical protein KDE27_13025 [Planctomycetes bacterium]|nr:hypothetical protein [Planctomycetota bacterium]